MNKIDLEKEIDVLKSRFRDLTGKLNPEEKRKKMYDLEGESLSADFWQDRMKAEKTLKELGQVKEEVDLIEDFKQKIESLEELLASIQEENIQDLEFISSQIKDFSQNLNKVELRIYLSNPYDDCYAILSLHAGQGGVEACDWAAMLYRMYYRFGEKRGWKVELADEKPAAEAGIKSATLFLKGKLAYGYLKGEAGVHRLVRLSPFNANNLRQTSFALVEVMPMFEEDNQDISINPKDLEIDFSRASGHGGQNINKVSTAVRIKHLPTGIIVECQTQRYQEQNRKIALQILKGKLWQLQEENRAKKKQAIRGEHKVVGWGNQIRSYVLHPYKLVKDLRTGWEENDPVRVLDGGLDDFIREEIVRLEL